MSLVGPHIQIHTRCGNVGSIGEHVTCHVLRFLSLYTLSPTVCKTVRPMVSDRCPVLRPVGLSR